MHFIMIADNARAIHTCQSCGTTILDIETGIPRELRGQGVRQVIYSSELLDSCIDVIFAGLIAQATHYKDSPQCVGTAIERRVR